MQTIPVFQPYLGPEVHQATTDALAAGWIGLGPLTREFEHAIGEYVEAGDRPVVTTSSGTAALHLATLAAGVRPGDEVIMPSFTYVASHQAIGMTGAEIVFCEVEEETLGADPDSIRRMISSRTKAIAITHYAGVPCRIDEILAIGAEHGIKVIQDAAQAVGSRSDGRPIGSFGDYTAFSFGPVKIVTTLEGGAVIAKSPDEEQALHEWRMLGVDSDTHARYARGRAWEYDVTRQGFRYHLGSIPAAIGLSQLKMLDTFIENRQQYCRAYHEGLAGIPGLRRLGQHFGGADQRDIWGGADQRDIWEGVSPFIYVVRVTDRDTRVRMIEHLEGLGVKSGIHWADGAHRFTHFKGCRTDDLKLTDQITDQVLTLPLHSFMSNETVQRVIDGVRSFYE